MPAATVDGSEGSPSDNCDTPTAKWKKRNFEKYYESAAALYSKEQERPRRWFFGGGEDDGRHLSPLDDAAVGAARALAVAASTDDPEQPNAAAQTKPLPVHLQRGSAYKQKPGGTNDCSALLMRERTDRVLRRQQQEHLERMLVETNRRYGAQQEENYSRELDMALAKVREEMGSDTMRLARQWVNWRWQQTVEEYEELARQHEGALALADSTAAASPAVSPSSAVPPPVSPSVPSPSAAPPRVSSSAAQIQYVPAPRSSSSAQVRFLGGGRPGGPSPDPAAARSGGAATAPLPSRQPPRRKLLPLPLPAQFHPPPDCGEWVPPCSTLAPQRRPQNGRRALKVWRKPDPAQPALDSIRHQVNCIKTYARAAPRTSHLSAMSAVLPPGYEEQSIQRSSGQGTPPPTCGLSRSRSQLDTFPPDEGDSGSGSELGAEELAEAKTHWMKKLLRKAQKMQPLLGAGMQGACLRATASIAAQQSSDSPSWLRSAGGYSALLAVAAVAKEGDAPAPTKKRSTKAVKKKKGGSAAGSPPAARSPGAPSSPAASAPAAASPEAPPPGSPAPVSPPAAAAATAPEAPAAAGAEEPATEAPAAATAEEEEAPAADQKPQQQEDQPAPSPTHSAAAPQADGTQSEPATEAARVPGDLQPLRQSDLAGSPKGSSRPPPSAVTGTTDYDDGFEQPDAGPSPSASPHSAASPAMRSSPPDSPQRPGSSGESAGAAPPAGAPVEGDAGAAGAAEGEPEAAEGGAKRKKKGKRKSDGAAADPAAGEQQGGEAPAKKKKKRRSSAQQEAPPGAEQPPGTPDQADLPSGKKAKKKKRPRKESGLSEGLGAAGSEGGTEDTPPGEAPPAETPSRADTPSQGGRPPSGSGRPPSGKKKKKKRESAPAADPAPDPQGEAEEGPRGGSAERKKKKKRRSSGDVVATGAAQQDEPGAPPASAGGGEEEAEEGAAGSAKPKKKKKKKRRSSAGAAEEAPEGDD
eukprot:TRINITY_DN8045_c0_g2_i3.p1 TRINITY_DN8045_c0_g2~~TRINITY_DN8045_c0_g2_i3.p1  ORF type:complete len:978 (+),score=307.37 TRINITY_DN8045_c0_g2_i3:79-3012(+)